MGGAGEALAAGNAVDQAAWVVGGQVAGKAEGLAAEVQVAQAAWVTVTQAAGVEEGTRRGGAEHCLGVRRSHCSRTHDKLDF